MVENNIDNLIILYDELILPLDNNNSIYAGETILLQFNGLELINEEIGKYSLQVLVQKYLADIQFSEKNRVLYNKGVKKKSII